MLSLLGSFIEQKTSAIPDNCDLPELLNLFLIVAQSQSFVVSIPILVTWTRLLRSEVIGGSPTVIPLVGPLLELCSSRLIRYENLPEDSEDPCMVFLLDDIDTIPERHAFLGNYRRYCIQIIETIVRRKRSDAIYHILGLVAQLMEQVYHASQPVSCKKTCLIPGELTNRKSCHLFNDINARTASGRAVYSCRSCTERLYEVAVISQSRFASGCIYYNGATFWRSGTNYHQEQERSKMDDNLQAWCESLLDMNFQVS